jgi:hypothetical protein
MVDVTGLILLTLLRFSGVSNVEALESFCNQYNYSPSLVLSEAIKAYLAAVSQWEQRQAEKQVYGPKVTVGVNV